MSSALQIAKPVLVSYEAARSALRKASTYDEVKDIRDRAIALEAYARQAKDTQLVEDAIEIKKRVERRTAEMIEAERKAGKMAGRGGDPKTRQGNTPVTLADAGISKMQASRWGKVAPSRMSEEQFEKHIEDSKAAVRRSLEPAAGGMDVHYSSETPEWCTPPGIIRRTERALGKIDLDPCSAGEKTIPAAKVYTKKDDGLSREWWGRVYMNIPRALFGDKA